MSDRERLALLADVSFQSSRVARAAMRWADQPDSVRRRRTLQSACAQLRDAERALNAYLTAQVAP